MYKKKIIAISSIFFFIFCTISLSIENKILFKIDNQIISSLDVDKEYKYLIALNPGIKKSKKEEIIKLSKKSIIQEKIKRIEIEKNFKNPKIPEEFLLQILRNVYSRIGLENLDEFIKYLKSNDINFEDVKDKLETEALWNELILIKFRSKIRINEEELKKRLEKNTDKFLKSYLMSEIVFEISSSKDLNKKFLEISETIRNDGFDFAAIKYSVSQTSNIGGKLDWIKDSSLNKNIKETIKDLEINDFTKPITVPGGFLILQINDIKNTKIEINTEKEIKKLIDFERNAQLNQYSKIYFNKVKKDININEL
jgi:peptidyl-prolyl cis-trans isomerase SurA